MANTGLVDVPVLDFDPEWELFDLEKDPFELNNVYADGEYTGVVKELAEELSRLQEKFGDEPYEP